MSDTGMLASSRLEPGEALQARLAEYQALRAESDRSAQLLSNSVWVGVTGFGLTIVGAGTFVSAGFTVPHIVPALALVLAVQSMAISTVYASELWKYARVGAYIRLYIESRYGAVVTDDRPPMCWETWIERHRASSLHLAALGFLQLPSLCLSAALGAAVASRLAHWDLDGSIMGRWASHLAGDTSLALVLGILLLVNIVLMVLAARRVKAAQRGDFGDHGKSLRDLSSPREA